MSDLTGEIVGDLRRRCKPLAWTAVLYKILAFAVLSPVISLLFRLLLATSFDTALTDQDILFYFLGPAGWLCLVVFGALSVALAAFELAALMAVLGAPTGADVGPLAALHFALANARPIILVAARLVAWTLLVVAPFLAVAAVVYFALLTEYDINFYLKEKPPAFLAAIGIGGVLAVACGGVLLRLATNWFFALPLVLFEDVSARDALGESRRRAVGHRRKIAVSIAAWALAVAAVSSLSTAAVVALGRLLVPLAEGSLELLVFAIGASLLAWAVTTLAVNLMATATFAALHFRLYCRLGRHAETGPVRMQLDESSARRSRFKLTRGRLVAASVLAVTAAAAIGVLAVGSVRLQDDVQVIAHRGASNAAPENTLAAIRRAIADGADWVEIDVQESADGQVVVFHDSDFMKLAGDPLKIWDATAADLQRIDIGSHFASEFSGERVPTLGDVLEACQGTTGVMIELKYYGHDRQLERRVAEVVDAHSASDRIVLMSLDAAAVRKMKALRPNWQVGQLLSVSAGGVEKIEADFLAVNATFADREFIRNAHAAGKDVFVWTVNDAVGMSTMIGRGVDGLITDEPALARSVLRQRAALSVPERLLLELATTFGVATDLAEQ